MSELDIWVADCGFRDGRPGPDGTTLSQRDAVELLLANEKPVRRFFDDVVACSGRRDPEAPPLAEFAESACILSYPHAGSIAPLLDVIRR